MAPDHFRKHLGFAGLFSAPLSLLTAVPALAQGVVPANLGGLAPLAVAVGAGGFALLSVALVRKILVESRATSRRAAEQIAGLRALVDEYENLIAGSSELTVLWSGQGAPRFLGHTGAVLPAGRQPQSILNLRSWLGPAPANKLASLIEDLRMHGHGFAVSLETLDGRIVRANGWVLGDATALRLRPAFGQNGDVSAMEADTVAEAEQASARAILAHLAKPAFLRDAEYRLVYANPAYCSLAKALGRPSSELQPAELLDPARVGQQLVEGRARNEAVSLPVDMGSKGKFEMVEVPVPGGRAGYLRPLEADPLVADSGSAHIGGIIGALATPIAIFNAQQELVQYNRAYAELWNLDPAFLSHGRNEKAILDKLRTEGMLPNQLDYRDWRAKHLQSYKRPSPLEHDPWHLPDGRTIKVISAPAGPNGGVIYVFEDITERLELESTNKALSNVQRETINALSEAVAVFGTNGRLTLCNPQVSALWKLPMDELGDNPHIDRLAEASGRAMPQDGATIWRDLKNWIVDLNPNRSDRTGRINRSDGRLIDYAVTRLPDGQTMITFLDVTESAGYSKVLKERNDALLAADQLKDAFVGNVSYELRSPLTNIIGFTDFLADSESGNLSDKQREYLDYIRASSVTLAVLIDNILDLTSVDAGIAELNAEPQDVVALVEKARAGLTASLHGHSGDAPNLVIDIDPGLPQIIADGTRMVQVLYNLLSNAVRFSPPGGEIRLSVRQRGERILFVIEDEGPGLTDEMKSAIRPRLDVPQQGAGRQRGSSLGLEIVRTFVNLHGGTISAEQREPRGSRITVNLPRDCGIAGVGE